jgi:hypothetical protein
MQCRELRDLVDAFIGGELLVETNHEILRHLESCPDCRAELAARRALRERLQRAFAGSSDLAPRQEWLTQVRTRLQQDQVPDAPVWRSARAWLAMAATFLVAVGIGAYVISGSRGAAALLALARSAVGDHLNCAVRFNLAEKPIPLAQAAARFDPAYEVLETTPESGIMARNGPIEVVDRHSCVFEGRRFAHVVMKYQGELVSLLVTADGSGPLTRLPPAGGASALSPADGYNVMFQHARGHAVFLVAGANADVLRDVADAIGATVTARLGAT